MIGALNAETLSEWRGLWRQPAFSIPTLAFPLMFYFVFGVLMSYATTPQASVALLANWTVFGIIGPGLFAFGVGLAEDRDQGWLRLKQASPLPAWTILASRILVAAAFALLIVVLMFATAALFAGVRMARSEWLALGLIALGGVVPFSAMGLAFGAHLGARAALAVVNVFYLASAMLSGLWFPLGMMPEFMQKLAWALPPFHLARLARYGAGAETVDHWLVSVLFLFCVTIIALAVAAPGLRRR